jgi:hypothetical protein
MLTFLAGLLWATRWLTVGPMFDNSIVAPIPHPVGPAKARMTKLMKVVMSRGVDVVHHHADAGKYLQVSNFSNFI